MKQPTSRLRRIATKTRSVLTGAFVPPGKSAKDPVTLVAMALLVIIMTPVAAALFTEPDRNYDRPSDLVAAAEDGLITEAVYYPDHGQVYARVETGPGYLVEVPGTTFADLAVSLDDADAAVTTDTEGTPDEFEARGDTPALMPTWLAIALLAPLVWISVNVIARTVHTRFVATDKTKTRTKPGGGRPETRFSDVAGADEAVDELREMVAYLKDPDAYTRLGAKPPKGALLVGPPGTGKTLLARAMAGEAGCEFITATGSDFIDKYVGTGARRIRALFARARQHENAIIFIDEIDAIGKARGGGGGGGAERESDQTLIALLAELDGFTGRGNILVIAATNRAETLDPALTRPGRLDRKVEVPNPDRGGRERILGVHTRGRPTADDVDLTLIASRTPGFSGAQLESVVNEACMTAARTGADQVTGAHFSAAIATVAMGRPRTSAVVTDHDATVTAWHEAGHTAAAWLLIEADRPVAVSIVPRGPAGGVTWMAGSDNFFLTRAKAHAQLVTALGGRVGEEMLLDGEFTSGASGDLAAATNLATDMITRYGMSDVGYTVRRNASHDQVIAGVEQLLVTAHDRATELLTSHRSFVVALATALLADKDLEEADINTIAARTGATPVSVNTLTPANRLGPAATPPLPARIPELLDLAAAGQGPRRPLEPAWNSNGHRHGQRAATWVTATAALTAKVRVLGRRTKVHREVGNAGN